MQARMTNPAVLIPAAMKGLYAYSISADKLGVPATTLAMVHLRASQINGCSVCVEMHSNDLKKAGETDERIATVGHPRDPGGVQPALRRAGAGRTTQRGLRGERVESTQRGHPPVGR